MASSKFLTVFLLLALVVLVNAQNNSTATNVINDCIKRENCAPDNRECLAACAGVPNPSPTVANNTVECYTKCATDNLPKNEDGYKSCIADCEKNVYQEGITQPGSKAPSAGAQNGGSGSDGGSSGSDSTSSDNSSGGSNDSSNTNGTDQGTGASFSAKSAHVYVFAAVIACVAFAVGL